MQNELEINKKELCDFISENILAGEVKIDASTILSDIGVDSFSIIEIILFIERKFKIIIPHESLTPENFTSVNTLIECMAKYKEVK
ncbi:MAG TPA: acyl carrier protein [Cytophagaceae bacterium]|jgi:acyl carrier protein|nr:acyl carrier protein [Cytophagaceae bacterium]